MYSKEKHPFGGPITVEQVQESRLITWPLTILHCCMVTDHGGAVIVASPRVAAGLSTKPVWIAGAGEAMGHQNMMEMEDFTATSAARSGEAAYTMAGLGPSDMEMAMLYDSFTITAAITAEMLGLAPKGEGHTLWKDGRAAPRGRFPINTNGGGLSFQHSGMYGMPLLIEAYRHLSGTPKTVSTATQANRHPPKPVLSTAPAATSPRQAPSSSWRTTNGRRLGQGRRRPGPDRRHGRRRRQPRPQPTPLRPGSRRV